jgi:hypothetical protein
MAFASEQGVRRTGARRNGPGRLRRDPASRGRFPVQARSPGLSKNCTKPAEVRVPACELAEACLAHAVGNATVHAYQRSSCWRGADF